MKKNAFTIIILLVALSACGQTQEERITNVRQSIIGLWVNEADPDYKIEFNSLNQQIDFIGDELQQDTVSNYEITEQCGNSGDNDFDIYLKRQDDSGIIYCDVINNLSLDISGRIVLSLTNDRGQLHTYIKQ